MRLFLLTLVTGLAIALATGCNAAPTAEPRQIAPATSTTAPTPTAVPATVTPKTVDLTAAAVVAKLQQAGLPLGDVVSYTAASDPNALLGRPGQYIGKASFRDSRTPAYETGIGAGGSVEVFATAQELAQRKQYITALASSPLFAEYDLANGLVLLRLSRHLTPDQVGEYEKALGSF